MSEQEHKTWTQVEEEIALLVKQERLRKKALKTLNSVYGASTMKIIDDNYVDTDTIHKNINKRWRILRIMDELEKNSFIKMWNEGWCSGCEFDSSKCAEQHECQAFRTLEQLWSDDNNEGGNNSEETI